MRGSGLWRRGAVGMGCASELTFARLSPPPPAPPPAPCIVGAAVCQAVPSSAFESPTRGFGEIGFSKSYFIAARARVKASRLWETTARTGRRPRTLR